MRCLARSSKVYELSRHSPPAIEVNAQETIIVETTDSADGQICQTSPGLSTIEATCPDGGFDPDRALPLTGPIYLRGAEPGDVIGAEVVGLVATGNAFVLPGFEHILKTDAHPGAVARVRVVELRHGAIQYDEHLQFPYGLMVGALGVAPAGDPWDTLTPGDHGGNHDCIHLRAGSTLYLPVQVPGALLSLGDVHAAMGDGEVAGTALECNGEVTLRLHLYRGWRIPGPLLETGEHWMIFGCGKNTAESIAVARHRATNLLSRRLGVDATEANMLLAAVGDLRLNEVVNPQHSARVELPKRLLGSPAEGTEVEGVPVPAAEGLRA